MPKVYVEVIKANEYAALTGATTVKGVMLIDKRLATQLIKKGVVKLAQIQKDMEGGKKEKIVIDNSPEVQEFLKRKDLLQCLVNEIQQKAVGEEKTIKALLITAGLAKVANKKSSSANICLNAKSGVGKDFVAEATFSILPENFVFARRRISPRALDYALARNQNRDWNQWLIYLEDVSDGILNSESIKTLMTGKSNDYNTATVVVDGEAKDLKIFGKPVFVFTTAKSKPQEETLRRVPFIWLDESEEQTLKILEKQSQEAESGKVVEETIVPKNWFSGLEKIAVVVPYATKVYGALKNKLMENKSAHILLRTQWPRFLDYMKSAGAINQFNRERNEKGELVLEPEDYDVAREVLLATTSNRLMIPITRDQKELYDSIKEHFPEGATVSSILLFFNKWEERWLRRNLNDLADKGFLTKEKVESTSSDRNPEAYSVVEGVFTFNIPTWKELFVQNSAISADCADRTISAGGANALPI